MTFKKYLIIPGLNQSPRLYDFLDLKHNNIELVKFPCNLDSREIYLNTPLKKYRNYLKDFSDEYDVVFCHSLGCLIFLLNQDLINYKKVFLIAPPFKSSQFLTSIFKRLPDNLLTPSLNLPKRRAFSFCSVGIFKQIIDIQESLRDISYETENISVVHDPRDELVRYSTLFNDFGYIEFYSRDFPRHLCLDFIEKYIIRS